ncbi:hypothetical protein HU200_011905 [Digitaria exilis]|uniref:Uncharacterized protein n=1 Tax=Digitaria exilis TaxID=1010633 RepID=A0A835FHB9_9POAL|nr:hypothetical protein HU200_011905 [Digitaria exilis]
MSVSLVPRAAHHWTRRCHDSSKNLPRSQRCAEADMAPPASQPARPALTTPPRSCCQPLDMNSLEAHHLARQLPPSPPSFHSTAISGGRLLVGRLLLLLMCLEDSADIDGGAGDEELLLLLCGDAEVEDDEEEYMGHLVSKESSFCCSPSSSSSSPAFSDFSEAGDESSSMPPPTMTGFAALAAPLSSGSSSFRLSPTDVRNRHVFLFLTGQRRRRRHYCRPRACFGFSHRTAYLSVAYFDRFCLHRCFDVSNHCHNRIAIHPSMAISSSVSAPPVGDAVGGAAAGGGVRVVAAKMEEYSAPALSEFSTGDDDEYEFSCVSIRRDGSCWCSPRWNGAWAAVTPSTTSPASAPCYGRRNNAGDGGIVAQRPPPSSFASAQRLAPHPSCSVLGDVRKSQTLTWSVAPVLDYRPSTVAVAAVLAAIHGAMTKETLESKMGTLSPSCLLDKEDVYACHSLNAERERELVGGDKQDSQEAAAIKLRLRSAPPVIDESIDAAATARSTAGTPHVFCQPSLRWPESSSDRTRKRLNLLHRARPPFHWTDWLGRSLAMAHACRKGDVYGDRGVVSSQGLCVVYWFGHRPLRLVAADRAAEILGWQDLGVGTRHPLSWGGE